MALTLDDVLTPATEGEFFAKLLSIASLLGLKVTSWAPTGITRTILRIVAKLEARGDATVSKVARGGFLRFAAEITPDPSIKLADGTYPGPGWLDLCADSAYDVQRIGSSRAIGPMVITNIGNATYGPFATGTFHIANSSTKKSYHNTAPITLGPSADTTATFEADEAGDGSTSLASDIYQMVTSLVNVSINPAKQSGTLVGSNAESNEELIQRCLNKLAALGGQLGPAEAYRYFATTATVDPALGGGGVTLAGGRINRVVVSTDPYNGVVTVTIANAAGVPSGPDVTAVNTYLQNVAVPAGHTTVTAAATANTIAVAVDVWVPSAPAALATDVVPLVRGTVGGYMTSLPIGGIETGDTTPDPIHRGRLLTPKGVPLNAVVEAAFEAASYISQAKVTLNGVASDVALAANEIAALSGTIAVNVHLT